MAGRRTKARIKSISESEVDGLITEYALLETRKKALEAELAKAIIEMKSAYAELINALKTDINKVESQLQMYAELNDAEFEKSRTKKFINGEIGFRWGMPKVVNLRGLKVVDVVELAKVHAPSYVKPTYKLDKDSIIKDVETLQEEGVLEKIGINVSQTERFFVKYHEVKLPNE